MSNLPHSRPSSAAGARAATQRRTRALRGDEPDRPQASGRPAQRTAAKARSLPRSRLSAQRPSGARQPRRAVTRTAARAGIPALAVDRAARRRRATARPISSWRGRTRRTAASRSGRRLRLSVTRRLRAGSSAAIAAQLNRLLLPGEALALVLERVRPLAGEPVPLGEALGRVLAADVPSADDVPALRQLRHGRLRRPGRRHRRRRPEAARDADDRRRVARGQPGERGARGGRGRCGSRPARCCRRAPTRSCGSRTAATRGESVEIWTRYRPGKEVRRRARTSAPVRSCSSAGPRSARPSSAVPLRSERAR